MRCRLLTSALLTALALSGGTADLTSSASERAASEAEPPLLRAVDPVDVTFTRTPGLSAPMRRSVELRQLRVTDRGRRVRFAGRVDRVVRSDGFMQLFLIDVTTRELPFGQISFGTHSLSSPSDPHGVEREAIIEGAAGRYGFVQCSRLPFSLRDGARWWWVEVPRRCLPRGRASVRVYAQTADVQDLSVVPRAEDRQWSYDLLRVVRSRDLGGTARPERSE